MKVYREKMGLKTNTMFLYAFASLLGTNTVVVQGLSGMSSSPFMTMRTPTWKNCINGHSQRVPGWGGAAGLEVEDRRCRSELANVASATLEIEETSDQDGGLKAVRPVAITSRAPPRSPRRSVKVIPPSRASSSSVVTEIGSNRITATKRKKSKRVSREKEADLVYRIQSVKRIVEAREKYFLKASSPAVTAKNQQNPPTEAAFAASLKPPLSVADLAHLVEQGHEARAALVAAHEGLVFKIAKRYQHRQLLGSALTLQDMIQEGKLGLMAAAERFDPTRGFQFSTYATFWIRQRILRCIADNSRTIRLPAHMHALLHNVLKAKRDLTAEFGRTPNMEELAQGCEISVEKLKLVLGASRHVVSLEVPLDGGNGGGRNGPARDSRILSDKIASDSPGPIDHVEIDFLRRDIRLVINEQLRDVERDVLILRFGLDDGNPKSIQDVSKRLELSRERVRLVEAKALNKLRQPRRNYRLKEYVGGIFQ